MKTTTEIMRESLALTTHTPNLDRLDPMAREILGDTLRGLFRIHPITAPVAPSDAEDRDTLAKAFGPLLPEAFK